MRHGCHCRGLALVAALFALAPATAQAAGPAAPIATEVIVRFKSDTTAAQRDAVRSHAGADLEDVLPLRGLQLVDPEPGVSVADAIERLERSGEVLYAEPDAIRSGAATANDPLFSSQWGLSKIGMPSAWDSGTGDPAITVGVIDSGVDYAHSDLSPNSARNPGESGGGRESNGRDDDGNGLTDDWRGWDWVQGDNNPSDPNGHGTHVAGTIGARGNNTRGVAGVAWRVKLMPLRVLDANNQGRISDVVAAYAYAGSKRLPIVNASLAGPTYSQAEHDAIKDASQTLFVVGAGNDARDNDVAGSYPCNHPLPNVICVTASDRDDGLPGFASRGRRSVDLAAPGVDIMSTFHEGRWGYMSGTSSATPHVTGVAALMLSRWPQSSVAALRAGLLSSVDRKPAFADRILTGGRLNAQRALSVVPNEAAFPPEEGIDPARQGPGSSGTGAESTRDAAAPILATRFATRTTLQALLRRGLLVRTRCSEACSLRLELTVARARVAGLDVTSSRVVVGKGRGTLAQEGSRVVRVRLSARSKRLLKRARPNLLTLGAVATDHAGNRATVRRALRIRR